MLAQGEKEHQDIKALYAFTNKTNAERDIALKEGRQKALITIKTLDPLANALLAAQPDAQAGDTASAPPKRKVGRPRKDDRTFGLGKSQDETLPATPFNDHHHISESRRFWEDARMMTVNNDKDPALKVRARGSFAPYPAHLACRPSSRN